MKQSLPIFGLLGCALLIGVAVLLAVTPREATRPRVPARLDTSPIAPAKDAAALMAGTIEEADTGPLPVPPPPPEIESGLEPGRLWMRVINAATNRPVADTVCVCILQLNDEDYGSSNFEGPPFRRTTDAHGLISFAVRRIIDGDAAAAPEPGHEQDVHLIEEYGAEVMPLPVPQGWLPVGGYDELFGYASAAARGVVARPLDVYVCRAASVVVTPRDADGLPLPDAEVRVIAVVPEEFFDSLQNAWMPDNIEMLFDYEWSEMMQNHVNDAATAGLQAWFQGAPMVNPKDGDDSEWRSMLDGTAGGRGPQRLEGLPLVTLVAVCRHPVLGMGTASVALQSGPNALDVTLRGSPGRLEVNVVLRGELPELSGSEPFLAVEQVTEYGTPWEGPFACWDAAEGTAVTGTSWRFTVTGLQPGFWSVEVEVAETRNRLVEIRPGEVTSITVYIGSDAEGEWRPIFRAGGQDLDSSPFLLSGGDESEFDRYTAVKYAGGWDTFVLTAGSYTAVVPTLPPFHFTIEPGQTREDVFDLKIAQLGFSIDVELHSLMLAGGQAAAGQEYVALDLLPIGEWRQNFEHLNSIHYRMMTRDETYDELKPGVVSPWLVPFGHYAWTIRCDLAEISGFIVINEATPAVTTFSVANLPGVAALLLEFDGFVGVAGSGVPVCYAYALPDSRLAPPHRVHVDGAEVWQMGSDGMSETVTHEVVGILDYANRRVLIVAGPGRCVIEVLGDVEEGKSELDGDKFIVHAKLPGRLRISAASLKAAVPATLVLKNGRPDEFEYHVVICSPTNEAPWHLDLDSENEVAAGRCQVTVSRGFWDEVRNTQAWVYAEIAIEIAPGRNEIDLAALEWVSAGSVVITCRGRGSPDRPVDAWWQAHLLGGSEGELSTLLLRLGDDLCPDEIVPLHDPSTRLPGGRLEFSYRLNHLQPGLYRFIPWPGAEDKWCRTFEVKPNEVTTVLVQGG